MGAPGPAAGLKRAVPGSVPPWRAFCAESAPALKAFLSVSLLESKFVQILRALNSGPRARAWAAGAAGPQLLWPSGRASASGPGSCPPARARVFRGPVVPGCRNVFRGRAVVFHFRQSRKRGSLSIITLDPLSERFRGRNALGFARRRTSNLRTVLQLSLTRT